MIYILMPIAAIRVATIDITVRLGPAGVVGITAVVMGVKAGVFSCILAWAASV